MKTKLAVIITLAGCFLCGNIFARIPDNLGQAYISNVTSGSNCVASTVNGGGVQFWDLEAGGTYSVTLSNVLDCDQGMDSSIDVIVRNSPGGNINATATQQSVGVYTFTVTLTTQCLTMPIEYCTKTSKTSADPGWQPGTGKFAQDDINGAAGGHVGHLRTATFTTDGSCTVTGQDTTCQGSGCSGASIMVTKFYDFNTDGTQQTGEQGLANWPFCLTSLTDPEFDPLSQTTGTNGTTTFSNLEPGTYVVTEGTGDGTWQNSADVSTITIDTCGQKVNVSFGNLCTVPSNGLTLGFWSNKNGQKIITDPTGKNLLPSVKTVLTSCSLRDAKGNAPTFFTSGLYADFRSWLLGATATNMAYMLSAQLATLELDVNFGVAPNKVDPNSFDICSNMTISALISTACNLLGDDGYTIAGDPNRVGQQGLKTCADQINNNGPVVPVTPCSATFSTFTCP